MILARVDGEEATASQRAHDFAKVLGNNSPRYDEGELVVVNSLGNVHKLNERTTGQTHDQIEKRLGTLDSTALLNVTDARAAQRETQRERAKALKELKTADRADTATSHTAEDEIFGRAWRNAATLAPRRSRRNGNRKSPPRARASIRSMSPSPAWSKSPPLPFSMSRQGVANTLIDFVGALLRRRQQTAN